MNGEKFRDFLKKPPSRPYLHNIINTLYPGYLDSVLKQQNEARNLVTADGNDGNAIRVTEEFNSILRQYPMKIA